MKEMPRPPPPFPQRLKKKVDDEKFSKFMAMLKQLTVNVTLVEMLEQISGYVKFINNLVTKKQTMSYEPMDSLYHCSAIAKKIDQGAFTVPCTIR